MSRRCGPARPDESASLAGVPPAGTAGLAGDSSRRLLMPYRSFNNGSRNCPV